MPWLVKNAPNPSHNILFLHIPRSGGTSLTQHFDIPRQSLTGRSRLGTIGLKFFFYRYHVFETVNFPVWTRENFVCLVVALVSGAAIIVTSDGDGDADDDDGGTTSQNRAVAAVAYLISCLSLCRLIVGSFCITVATCNRIRWLRRIFLFLVHHVFCRAAESIEWLTGVNETGYMLHLTAYKMLAHGYVTPETMDKCYSLTVVRNPYSRMVSLYMYNRFGPHESFRHFVKSWYHNVMYHYRTDRRCDDVYTPSHALPQFEFTHWRGRQLVQCVIKSEDVKYLSQRQNDDHVVTKEFWESHSDLAGVPAAVRDVFVGVPHVNGRQYDKKWWDYYDQETLNWVYELYAVDFYVFGYDPCLTQRSDLMSPETLVSAVSNVKMEKMVRNVALGSETDRMARRSLMQECYLANVKRGARKDKKV